MLKNFGLQHRKSGMDHAAFVHHWMNVHAPLSAGVQGVRGYVINEVLQRCETGALTAMKIEPPVDGVAQLWFNDAAAMQATAQTPEAKRWFGDGMNYLGARTGLVSSEREIVRLSPSARCPFKLMQLLEPAVGVSTAIFQRTWSEQLGPTVATLMGVRGYLQSDVSAVNPATNMPAIAVGAVAGVEEWWFDSQSQATACAQQIARDRTSAYATLCASACLWLMAETVVIIPPLRA
jgi:uncharacterized protein (TIGR02118 family)